VKYQFSAGIVIYFQEQGKREYLLLHYQAGHWDFPKGKIDPGETKQEAALRELKEETGLEVDLNQEFENSFEYFFKDDQGELIKKKVYFFVGQVQEKQVVLSHEHIDFGWFIFDHAYEKLTYENAKNLLVQADAYLKNSE